MSGLNHLNRLYSFVSYSPADQEYYMNLQSACDQYGMDTVFVGDDSEWDISEHVSQEIEGDFRDQKDLISHQYVMKYSKYPAVGIVIYRKRDDPVFTYWDLLSAVRFYLHKVNYNVSYTESDYQRLARQLGLKKKKVIERLGNSYRVPPITWVGFFSGVDVTAYADWKKYLDQQKHTKTNPNFVALNKQEFFSSDYSVEITNPHSRSKKYPVTLKFVDTMALGPQGGLAALGDIVGQKKLNTKDWDKEDKLITLDQYKDKTYGGYYKEHMRELLKRRPADYQKYALGDSEVTLKYLDNLLGNVIKVFREGLIEKVHIPATLTSLADEISSHYSKLPYDENTTKDIYNSIFEDIDVEQFLRPVAFNQKPPRDKEVWNRVLKAVTDGSPLPGRSKAFGYRKLFIKKLEHYLARSTVAYAISESGNPYRRLSVSVSVSAAKLATLIDYKRLYQDNPDFNISELDNQKVKPSSMKFYISTALRNHYADHAHQFNYTKNNVAPAVDEFLNMLYEDSVYSVIPWFNDKGVIEWSPLRFLTLCLNFDKMRKGYDFVEPNATDKKHQKNNHDRFTVRPDSVYNDGYLMALHAYVGGMNLALNPGVISDAYERKYDIDSKSSYVTAGHLIPDFRLDTKPLFDLRDLDTQDLRNLYPKLPNGPFTVGVTNVSYHFPDDVWRVPVGYKPPVKDVGPVYVRQANGVDMTLTDVFDIVEHGGEVRIHRLIVPVQKTLNGDIDRLAPIGRMQHWSLIKRNDAKDQLKKYENGSSDYRKYDALQLFYKLLGNGGYGKSGQGLGASSTRDFLSGESMYVPFSRNTNPYTAAQYTSIARFQVNALMDLVEKMYPDSLIPSVTTDGFIFCTNDNFDEEELRKGCERTFDKRWVQVTHDNFNGQFFELKSHNANQKYSTTTLYNIRTRFNMTEDGHIKALVGLQEGEWNIKRVIEAINDDVVTFKIDDFRIQSLVDMKHTEDHKHYTSMKTWQQPKYLNFSPDDTYQPIGFVVQGDFGYYLTRPFATFDELQAYRDELKPYRSLFPAFREEYAEQFINLDQSVKTYTEGLHRENHVSWVHEDVFLKNEGYIDLIDYYQNKYVSTVMLRYLAAHQEEYDLKKVYENFYNAHYKRFASFNQALKRNKNMLVNPLCVIKEKFDEKLKTFR